MAGSRTAHPHAVQLLVLAGPDIQLGVVFGLANHFGDIAIQLIRTSARQVIGVANDGQSILHNNSAALVSGEVVTQLVQLGTSHGPIKNVIAVFVLDIHRGRTGYTVVGTIDRNLSLALVETRRAIMAIVSVTAGTVVAVHLSQFINIFRVFLVGDQLPTPAIVALISFDYLLGVISKQQLHLEITVHSHGTRRRDHHSGVSRTRCIQFSIVNNTIDNIEGIVVTSLGCALDGSLYNVSPQSSVGITQSVPSAIDANVVVLGHLNFTRNLVGFN